MNNMFLLACVTAVFSKFDENFNQDSQTCSLSSPRPLFTSSVCFRGSVAPNSQTAVKGASFLEKNTK